MADNVIIAKQTGPLIELWQGNAALRLNDRDPQRTSCSRWSLCHCLWGLILHWLICRGGLANYARAANDNSLNSISILFQDEVGWVAAIALPLLCGPFSTSFPIKQLYLMLTVTNHFIYR